MKPYYLSLGPLLLGQTAERPIDWPERFGRQAPLEVEIGFGNGEFLVRNAASHPDHDFVGLEVAWASTKRALRRIAREGLGNIRLAQIDARLAFQRLFKPRSLNRVYSLFPIPWPKRRHGQRRLFSHEFLRLLNSRLVSGGEAKIVTDYKPLSGWIMGQAQGAGFRADCRQIPAGLQTKYERKWQENGQDSFYEILLDKKEHIEIPLTKDEVLVTYRLKKFEPGRFRPLGQEGPIAVRFREFIYDPQREKGLVMALVAEDGLIQFIWIETIKKGNDWLLRVAPGGSALPTAGVRRALELAWEAASS